MIRSHMSTDELWPHAIMILATMQPMLISPNYGTYASLISILSKSARWSDALHCLGQMNANSFQADNSIYRYVINACEKARVLSAAVLISRSVDLRIEESK